MIHRNRRTWGTQEIEDARLIDKIASEFEQQFRENRSRPIESILSEVPPALRVALFRELIAIEIEIRSGEDESVTYSECQVRFGELADECRDLFPISDLPELDGFDIESSIGIGGCGQVYLAHDRDLNREVAIKLLLKKKTANADGHRHVLHEARSAAKLQHASIVPVFQVRRDRAGRDCIIMGYIAGESLADRLKHGPLPLSQTLDILTSVAEAVHYAHSQGIIHRDLKPANILLNEDGRPFVTDFGLAIDATLGHLREGEVAGTPSYMAPEQVAGEAHRISVRTDIWALGVILHEMLTARRPFLGETREDLFLAIRHDPCTHHSIGPEVPGSVARVIENCLNKQAARRFASAKELADELQLCQSSNSSRAQLSSSLVGMRVPKGLRSYTKDDAAYFCDLLEGPRDRFGLPLQIRFWKFFLEEGESDHAFPVGVLFGPSGSGKSSLIQAGVLPHLDDGIVAIRVEATQDNTEVRILKAIRKTVPELDSDWTLPEVVAHLRERPFPKVVLVIDQFEQWLHGQPPGMASQLVDALRQCDGVGVQALIVVREEFWMSVSQFMQAIDSEFIEGRNAAPIQLLTPSHTSHVLQSFAVSCGKAATPDLERFAKQAAYALAEDGVVVPIRLALLTETIGELPWQPSTLKSLGGIDGIAVRYLESTFDHARADLKCKKHVVAARQVLKALLPPEGQDIRGRMLSSQELTVVSGYSHRPCDFRELMQLLDIQLRLITPTHPEGEETTSQQREVDSEPVNAQRVSQYYQLSHDYLIPTLRSWITKQQRETWRGRAELCLSERSKAWTTAPLPRQLPTWLEWLSILAFTRGSYRSRQEQRMLRAASRMRLRQLALILIATTVCSWAAIEMRHTRRATSHVETLTRADIREVPAIVEELLSDDSRIVPLLKNALMSPDRSPGAHLNTRMALLPHDASQLDALGDELIVSSPEQAEVLAGHLWQFGNANEIKTRMWQKFEDEILPDQQRLLACACLACAPTEVIDDRWTQHVERIAAILVGELAARPAHFRSWASMFQSKLRLLQPSLAEILQSNEASAPLRQASATLLATSKTLPIQTLVDLALRAEPEHLHPFLDVLSAEWPSAYPLIEEAISQDQSEQIADPQKILVAKRRANAAIISVLLGEDVRSGILAGEVDPTLRSAFLDRVGRVPMSPNIYDDCVQQILSWTHSVDSLNRHAAVLCLGQLARPDELSESVSNRLTTLFFEDPDSGVHSAVRWALARWDITFNVKKVGDQPMSLGTVPQNSWFEIANGTTMVKIPAPGATNLGTQDDSEYQEADEQTRIRRIDRSFAIATTEVTQSQFLEIMPEFSHAPNSFCDHPQQPINAVTWYDAVKFCRLLSEKEGIPEEEMCYPPIDEIKQFMKPFDDYLERTGYRLPTEAEWEYACRAGSTTPWFFGLDPLVNRGYSCTVENSLGTPSEVASFMPNPLGLFDTHGNVREWCQDRYLSYEAESEDEEDTLFVIDRTGRLNRGGSFATDAPGTRSANRRFDSPSTMYYQCGFRIARTIRDSN